MASTTEESYYDHNGSPRKYTVEETNKIYTDWANYYLEKAKCKRLIQDLQVDVTDGVILTDVVEAVTNLKIPDVNRKPKNSSQMLENIRLVLVFLTGLGVYLEGVRAQDIRDGTLKSILTLFFQLSRHKQQQKQQDRDRYDLQRQQQQQQQHNSNSNSNRPITSESTVQNRTMSKTEPSQKLMYSFVGKQGSLTGQQQQRKSQQGLLRPVTQRQPASCVKVSSGQSSRSASPLGPSTTGQSLIPTPRSSISVLDKNTQNNNSRPSPNVNSKSSNKNYPVAHTNGQQIQEFQPNIAKNTNTSMLEKFRFFKDKDKDKGTLDKDKIKSSTQSKRTSSSSGFSSARSEKSDSSVSLCSESKGSVGSRESNIEYNHTQSNSHGVTVLQQSSDQTPSVDDQNSCKASGIKGFRQKIGRAMTNKEVKPSNGPSNNTKQTLLSTNSKIAKSQEILKPQQTSIQMQKQPMDANKTNSVVQCQSESSVKMTNQIPVQSFLRQPKVSQGVRGSRYSGTGIPTRNSLLSSTTYSASSSSIVNNGTINNNNKIVATGCKEEISQNVSKVAETSQPLAPPVVGLGLGLGTGIPKPMAAVKGTSKISSLENFIEDIQTNNTEESSSVKSDKPKSESGEINGISDEKLEVPVDKSEAEEEDLVLEVTPMEPILRSTHYLKSPTRSTPSNQNHNQSQSYDQEHLVTFPRNNQCQSSFNGSENKYSSEYDYADIDNLSSHGPGYLSEGDVLVNTSVRGSNDGYLSESGRSIYAAKRAHSKCSKNNAKSQNVNPEHSQIDRKICNTFGSFGEFSDSRNCKKLIKGRIDDSSSISSGVSDLNLNEIQTDLTSSSINSELSSPYASLQRASEKDYSKICEFTVDSQNNLGPNIVANQVNTRENSKPQEVRNDKSDQDFESSQAEDLNQMKRMEMRGRVQMREKPQNQYQTDNYQRGPNSNGNAIYSNIRGKKCEVEDMSNQSQRGCFSNEQLDEQMRRSRVHHQENGGNLENSQRPRTTRRVRVSGGTQTTEELEEPMPIITPHGAGGKSLSMTASTAAQLSASLRERLLGGGCGSLPKGSDYAALLASLQLGHIGGRHGHVRPGRNGPHHGHHEDQQDNGRSAMVTSKGQGGGWTRHSTGYTSSRTIGGSLTEGESLESLSSSSSLAAQMRTHNSSGHPGPKGTTSDHQRHHSPSKSPRLNRSSSISQFRERTFPRSTKSEKLYHTILQQPNCNSPLVVNTLPNNGSGSTANRLYATGQINYSPSSDAHNSSSRLSTMSPYSSGFLTKITTKEDEINGSCLSLVSTSSIYSSQEDKQAHEIRKLKRELNETHEKVQTLTNQLSTNAYVVAAFEQSLSNMTQRLQSLTASAEQKDSELTELRRTIEILRKQSLEAGIHLGNVSGRLRNSRDGSSIARQLSADSVSSINSFSSGTSLPHSQQNNHNHHHHHHSQVIVQDPSTAPASPDSRKKHPSSKAGWLRSSFSRAFSRGGNKGIKNGQREPPIEPQGGLNSVGNSAGCSSSSGGSHSPPSSNDVQGSSSSSALCDDYEEEKTLEELKKQLREKEMVLTDVRLESLASAHQLESLKDTVSKMKNELINLKQDNERLQSMVRCKTSPNSQNPVLNDHGFPDFRQNFNTTQDLDLLLSEPSDKDGKRVIVTVFLGCHGDFERFLNHSKNDGSECLIASLQVTSITNWDVIDSLINRLFKAYLKRIDPETHLGLDVDSIAGYNIGEVVRTKGGPVPELLPYGYLVGNVNNIRIFLKGVVLHGGALDGLVFESLVPKPILQRYLSHLSDNGRMIICGPSGTGKSYLARKLGEFMVELRGIVTFTSFILSEERRDHQLTEFLRKNLPNEPFVLLLENLENLENFSQTLGPILNRQSEQGAIIIGTMTHSSPSIPNNVKIHQNFRWVLFDQNAEPVSGLLGRVLQKRLIEAELQAEQPQAQLTRVVSWLPSVRMHLNRFLKVHHSNEVAFGPALFSHVL